jgi:hypothetical protein
MQIDRLNPGLLRALLAVADHGSISAAAEDESMNQRPGPVGCSALTTRPLRRPG